MQPKIGDNHPLRRFFAGSLQNAFYSELGLCAPEVVEYLSGLLVEFLHVRDIYALKSVSGDTLIDAGEMIAKAYLGPDVDEQVRARFVHRHVGDYLLYWSGMYPESIGSAAACPRITSLTQCYTEGRKAYAVAGELSSVDDEPPAETLVLLSEHFEDCAQGLRLARCNWDRLEDDFGLLS